MARRVFLDVSTVPDQKICVLSAEDVCSSSCNGIVWESDLRAAMEDVFAMLKTQQPHLDQTYLARWAALLALTTCWSVRVVEAEGDFLKGATVAATLTSERRPPSRRRSRRKGGAAGPPPRLMSLDAYRGWIMLVMASAGWGSRRSISGGNGAPRDHEHERG